MLGPIMPLAVAGLLLVGCAKVASDVRKNRPLATLAGSEWGPISPKGAVDTEQFIGFRTNNELVGFGGCNRFFGTYEQDGTRLTIGALASTKRACPNLAQEQAFLTKLQYVRRVDATHKAMTLFDANDVVLIQMQRRDWD